MKDTLKSMYDSLVRTYTPMIVGAVLGWLTTLLPIIPPEIESGLIILIGLAFQFAWYFIARLIEVVRGHASKLLTFGLVKSEPLYGEVLAKSADGEVALVNTQQIDAEADRPTA